MAKDLYEILEVERDVSASGLKSSYRGLARRYHPDANPDDPEAESNFKEIAAAYEVLAMELLERLGLKNADAANEADPMAPPDFSAPSDFKVSR